MFKINSKPFNSESLVLLNPECSKQVAIKRSEPYSEEQLIHGNYWNNEMKFYNNEAYFSVKKDERESDNRELQELYPYLPSILLKDVPITSFIEEKDEINLTGKTDISKSSYYDQGSGEPIQINMKQYHRILKRRIARARIQEILGKRDHMKPYLHESRHRHAMKRPRGPGGQFIKNKQSSEEEIMNELQKNNEKMD
ncbi:hypothetical protein PNEG_02820 [Pneumocystis murina B123]|uniref:Transcriptional activator HAP2 n=1 Tax=Pneumocystis murina (strain B123) TaxID=1069680 RepID=M7NK89_PNEMU|nr:hypothetical protein PNEG_02820 [Pneumocystis murina B123]EMR09048.1 hypothetical protein PNEG_02820 [Pneumocystis murina B123]